MDESDIKREIKRLIVTELDLRGKSADDIDDNERLFGGGLGLDSLDALQLATAMEERFGVKMPDDERAKGVYANVANLAEFVLKSQSE
jgi:acyl carrier protein